ncbi:unnamed protein product [Urochloa decumbens]|uniref:F-box domain-containing protein n=1 Tax=Urochloa decumbens TaxID=240449 RepID=A0ABC9BKU6_9POAL
MHPKVTKRSSASRRRERGVREADRLSTLPDALLHHIMLFLKAWEVVRTCVLARRWRHLWTSVPCLDLRVREDDHTNTPEDFPEFVSLLFLHREASARLDTLRLQSSNVDGAHDEEDARLWIRTAIKLGARVIHLVGHRRDWFRGSRLAQLEHVSLVSSHLKILKLSYALLRGNILEQLSSYLPSLEELELKDCFISACEISSASLKILVMFKCDIFVNLSVAAPNLVLLRCISPIAHAPSFQNMRSLVTGTIILYDYAFTDSFYKDFSKDELCETTDEDDDNQRYKTRHGFGVPPEGYGLGYNDDYNYGSDIDSDDDNKIEGGRNILQSLSNATSLELLADAGEVILNRELKSCPSFSNLKMLSLGEWCMDAEFNALIFFLQHSPNLEKLFLELKLNFNTRKPLDSGVKPKGRSFACKHLWMVNIKCSEDDARVHKLAHLFRANGIPDEKIFVSYLRDKKITEFWWED